MLLREVLNKTGKVGIARVVIRTREYLSALMPLDDALILDLMRFPQELVKSDQFALPAGNSRSYRVTAREVEMASQLLDSMTTKWKPENYKDEFRARLHKMIDAQVAKRSGRKARAAKTAEIETAPDATTNVVDFMSLLKRSLDKKGNAGGHRRARSTSRKPAAHEKRSRSRNGRRKAS